MAFYNWMITCSCCTLANSVWLYSHSRAKENKSAVVVVSGNGVAAKLKTQTAVDELQISDCSHSPPTLQTLQPSNFKQFDYIPDKRQIAPASFYYFWV